MASNPSSIVDYRAGREQTVRFAGTPAPLGVIVSAGTSLNNHDTAAPFNNTGVALKGKTLLICPTAAGRVLPPGSLFASAPAALA